MSTVMRSVRIRGAQATPGRTCPRSETKEDDEGSTQPRCEPDRPLCDPPEPSAQADTPVVSPTSAIGSSRSANGRTTRAVGSTRSAHGAIHPSHRLNSICPWCDPPKPLAQLDLPLV